MRHVYVEFCTKTWGSTILDEQGQMIRNIQVAQFQLDAQGESTARLFFPNGVWEDCTWSPYRVVDTRGEPVTEWGDLTNRPQLPPPEVLPCE